ncbi:molybdopterin molybdotransferase MoeA [Mucilaginibacter gynuensis]|uniref:Molybdopterin molybdenumtransferase n=1 Tax=Mucilaginibacter gynuensis TaxID=1302236 RepID=A0ABP8G0N1_9SPHI
MITVAEAEEIIQDNKGDFGKEIVLFNQAAGRILAETIKTDRDLPPYNRITVDGIAVSYQAFASGIRSFRIKATQAAGDEPVDTEAPDECIEVMTGAALPATLDTVIRYEDIEIKDGIATILTDNITQGESIHYKGADRKEGDVVAIPGQVISPAVISLITSVGETEVRVKKTPRVVVISSGDELVPVDKTPTEYQVRQSNSFTVQAALKLQGVNADVLHVPDDVEKITGHLQQCLHAYDAIILTGGISMGKFDYIPQVLKNLEVEQLFHKVQQRPGKPFWFGRHEGGSFVFAFPGNPVAVFLCMQRYFLPWLHTSMDMPEKPPVYAMLDNDLEFKPDLQYFLQVKLLVNEQAQVTAIPLNGNGSGDFSNLADADAFMELPAEKTLFKKGEVYRVYLISSIT